VIRASGSSSRAIPQFLDGCPPAGGDSDRLDRSLPEAAPGCKGFSRPLAAVPGRGIVETAFTKDVTHRVSLDDVENLDRGRVVEAQGVGAQLPELAEVPGHLVGLGQEETLGILGEGAVGDASHPELLVTQAEELAVDADWGGWAAGADKELSWFLGCQGWRNPRPTS
jgi:hypothetical protein